MIEVDHCIRFIACPTPEMHILYTTDLHGVRWKFNRVFEVARRLRVDAVVNGGDLMANESVLQQERFLNDFLEEYFTRFDEEGIHHLSYLGNDDLLLFDDAYEYLCAQHPFAHHLAQRKIELGGYEFIGMNWVVDYPFRLKDRCRMDTKGYVFQHQLGTGLISSENGWMELKDWPAYAATLPTLKDELESLPMPSQPDRAIYVLHMPPSGLGLDKCSHGAEVGSIAIRDFLLEKQPLLSLHGHIHESPQMTGIWKARLGKTLSIQPGQAGALTYVTVSLPDRNAVRYEECEKE